ncbi:MAG: hypothetical protein E6772_16090 [Dysgonomonas sp.]|nr:hypothetical protein [Dysgonomonas sp.]
MKKLFVLIAISMLCTTAYPQQVLQLIGIEGDDSSFSQGSYSVMYDDTDDRAYNGKYTPYNTLAVSRNGDEVKFFRQVYLIVPTALGFRYVANEVIEIPNDTTQAEMDFERFYTLRSSKTKPKFLTSKKEVENYIRSLDVSFVDAISVDYEKITFITPNFYITEGFESEVHGGAAWFDAREKCNFYKLNPKFGQSSNYLVDYLDRDKLNEIIIDAVKDVYSEEESPEEPIDENFSMPWAGTLGNYEEVYFSFIHLNNRVRALPFVLLNGNAHRSFLAEGILFEDEALIKKFGIKQYGAETTALRDFVSPDGSTRTSIDDKKIKVYDNVTNKLLAETDIPFFRRIVMSEWALGKYVEAWEKEF